MKKDRKAGNVWLIVGALLGYYSVANSDAIQRIYTLLFHRGVTALLPYLQSFPYLIAYLLMPVLAVVSLLIGLVRRFSNPKENREEIHTHDRIDRISYNVNETEADHYKKQLNGFLKAGLIEKDEYNILIKRYR